MADSDTAQLQRTDFVEIEEKLDKCKELDPDNMEALQDIVEDLHQLYDLGERTMQDLDPPQSHDEARTNALVVIGASGLAIAQFESAFDIMAKREPKKTGTAIPVIKKPVRQAYQWLKTKLKSLFGKFFSWFHGFVGRVCKFVGLKEWKLNCEGSLGATSTGGKLALEFVFEPPTIPQTGEQSSL